MKYQEGTHNIRHCGSICQLSIAAGAGVVMFHRSGDAEVGLHGNSGMWCASYTALAD